MKELIIELPEKIDLYDDLPYSLLSNNLLRINFCLDTAGRKKDRIIIPLPKPRGMWIVKNVTDFQMFLIDV